MAMNKSGEITREAKQKLKDESTSSRIRFEKLFEQLKAAKQRLCLANTQKDVTSALDDLSNLMDKLSNQDVISGLIADISGTMRGIRLGDATRTELAQLLQKLLEALKEVIAEEKKKENASKLKAFFLELAEHSDEIAQIINSDNIFG